MKLGIYAICRNEQTYVGRWLTNLLPELRPGDSITVLDTGSDDDTVRLFRGMTEGSKRVRIEETRIIPWRFDVARNAALTMVPPDMDMAWSLDLDEFPQPGWRQAIEDAWDMATETGTSPSRLRYHFTWNFDAEGNPGWTFWADKLHARHGFVWKGIAHEWLEVDSDVHPNDPSHASHVFTGDLKVHHHQDDSKERYDRDMTLMERALKELPDNHRIQYYYGRQLYFAQRNDEARVWLQKTLDNPKQTWADERSQAMIYMCWAGGGWQWLLKAAAEAPHRREPWYRLACWERDCGNYELALGYALTAAHLPDTGTYLEDPAIRGEGPRRLVNEIRMLMLEKGAQDAKPVDAVAEGAGTAGAGGAT